MNSKQINQNTFSRFGCIAQEFAQKYFSTDYILLNYLIIISNECFKNAFIDDIYRKKQYFLEILLSIV